MTKRRLFRVVTPLIAIATWPLCLFAVIQGWAMIDTFRGHREVLEFIDNHHRLVAGRLADSKVHSFSLSYDPKHSGTLLIQFDVEDKETYEMLESDLDAIWGMLFPPRWETNIRSNEELGNNWGYAAGGMGLAMEGMSRLVIAIVLSLIVSAIVLWLGFRSPNHHRVPS